MRHQHRIADGRLQHRERHAAHAPAFKRIGGDAARLDVAAAALAVMPIAALACTRVVYLGANDDVITARSMDWKQDIATHLYVLPRGVARNGEAGPNSLKWVARYGSVVATAYDVATTDGMNEKGLAAELLWLVESRYPTFDQRSKPGLTIAACAQYVPDNFATVAEAVDALGKEPFTVVTDSVPGEQRLATLHLSMSDARGDSAIIEYIDGRQVIHHGRQYQVMTNSPTFDEQLALNACWQRIGGMAWLPAPIARPTASRAPRSTSMRSRRARIRPSRWPASSA